MPLVKAVQAIEPNAPAGADVSTRIAPPYDVLDESSKADLLARDPHNIVAIDLPHLPPKTVGPDAVYAEAGETYRHWLAQGVLRRGQPAMYAYRQTFTVAGETFRRLGLVADVTLLPFGKSPDGRGGIFPHEQTFGAPKEDRLKLMRATRAQLSPVFGLYSDPQRQVAERVANLLREPPTFTAVTSNDAVRHEAWRITDPAAIADLASALLDKDVFIADGHHRYTTALNYRSELEAASGDLPVDHPANFCLFVLVAMQEPGMIVLPTHRVLGAMANFTLAAFTRKANEMGVNVTPFPGTDLAALEAALPARGHHAIGLYDPANPTAPLAIATTIDPDPLQPSFPDRSPAWRQLDVAIVQHLIVDQICKPAFNDPTWKFPHALADLKASAEAPDFQLGLILQPTPLDAVRRISAAGELMPQKSTFFFPKLATGLVIHPLD